MSIHTFLCSLSVSNYRTNIVHQTTETYYFSVLFTLFTLKSETFALRNLKAGKGITVHDK